MAKIVPGDGVPTTTSKQTKGFNLKDLGSNAGTR